MQLTQLKAAEQMAAVASEKQQKEANIKEALEEQLAQVLYELKNTAYLSRPRAV